MKKLLLPFVALAFCFFTQVSFAQRFYMKAGALTKDASNEDKFRDYAEITSRQFSASAESSQPNFQNMVVTKFSDISSNKLLTALTKGTRIEEVEIVATTSLDGTRLVTNKIQLKNAIILTYATSAANGCEQGCAGFAESYRLAYDAIKITTYTQDKTGKWTADPQPFMYNTKTQTSSY